MLDERTTQVMGSCLGTPVILRQVLESISTAELVELSLVNKQWNYEARTVLRDRGTLSAKIESGDRRRDLAGLASDLEKMRVVPFSGISVTLYHDLARICESTSSASYNVILDRLPVKTLSVEFCLDWDQCEDCPVFLLVEKILANFCGVLKDLSLIFHWDQMDRVQDCFTNPSFPRLKTLKLDAKGTNGDFTIFIKKLVASAPDLQELHMDREICLDDNVLEGSSAVLVPWFGFNPIYERVCRSLVPALRPESIEIYQRGQGNGFNQDILDRHIPSVLQVSVATLTTFKMDLLFALPLMCYGICLGNVTKLEIRLDGKVLDSLEPRILALLKLFHFTRIFPKVSKVKIEGHMYEIFSASKVGAFVEQACALRIETLGDGAINIKQLTLQDSICDSTIPVMAHMFPHVQKLSVKKRDYNRPTPFTSLWDHFKFLQELNFTSSNRPAAGCCKNLDSLFCGMFQEEVAELREKDDEYLKAVNIVPVMPSITCMKNLRAFTFRYTPEPYMPGPGIDRPTFWFSKVTGFIGFARCPNLAVTFQTRSWPCAEALSHMEPFATFVELD